MKKEDWDNDEDDEELLQFSLEKDVRNGKKKGPPIDNSTDEASDSVPLLEINAITGSLDSYVSSLGDLGAVNAYKQYKPKSRFLWEFPNKLEEIFRPFDDRVISWVQFTTNKVIDIICNLITFSVAIEIIFAVPYILFCTGYDGLGSEFTYLAIATAIFSQIPKRFVWRYRPWMVQRAIFIRKTKTSSFPSRAVCCSAVYMFAICYCYIYFADDVIWWWMPLLFIIYPILVSFSRVFLGVHYPSDCVFGFIQGLIICIFGTLLWRADLLGCTSCHEYGCYAQTGSPEQLVWGNLRQFSVWPFIAATVISLFLTLITIVKPVEFWKKSDKALGLLLPCVAFQVGFLCPNGSSSHSSLGAPEFPPPWWSYIYAVIFPAIFLLVAQKLKFKYPLITFSIFYAVILSSLVLWRVFVLPVETVCSQCT